MVAALIYVSLPNLPRPMVSIASKVESDDFCVEVLKCRQRDGLLPACGISRDVVTYQPSGDALAAELVVGGFPCQVCCSDWAL